MFIKKIRTVPFQYISEYQKLHGHFNAFDEGFGNVTNYKNLYYKVFHLHHWTKKITSLQVWDGSCNKYLIYSLNICLYPNVRVPCTNCIQSYSITL